MKHLATITAIALALTSCHSERHVATATADSLHSVRSLHIDTDSYFTAALKSDSLKITLTADSLRTPSGSIVYGPRLDVAADAPEVDIGAAASVTTDHSDDTAASHNQQTTEQTHKDTAAGGTIARSIIAVALLLLLCRAVIKFLK